MSAILQEGDPAPWFKARTPANPKFVFDTAGGRYLVMGFFGSAADPVGAEMLKLLEERRALFDDEKISFFGVSVDPEDEAKSRVKPSMPGIRLFWDFDRNVSRLYGAATGPNAPYARFWMVLGPTLRVRKIIPAREDGSDRAELAGYLEALPPVEEHAGIVTYAPILIVPQVFEPELCERLIALYEEDGGYESGFMREINGLTTKQFDYGHKRRRDYRIEDDDLITEVQRRVAGRIAPEIAKVHQFKVTRMERYIVGCYEAETGGHFRPHRDNVSKGTAHRRFAVSINLNDAFEGGELYFPEYGTRSIKIPTGCAGVFSCSLLHAVTPVTAGRRFCFLPFLYDDEGARIRAANNRYLAEGVGQYRAEPARGG